MELEMRNEPVKKNRPRTSWLRGALHSESGQSLVELALLTPILLLLVIGTVEMGRYASLSVLVGNAARAGAAYGAQNHIKAADAAGIESAAKADASDITGLTVTSTFVCGCDNGGTIIPSPETFGACGTACNVGSHLVVSSQVTVSGTFTSLFNYPGIPSPLTLTSTATERVAQ